MEKYAVAEIFESIQGEGLFAGTPMIFVRLAGCNVGKPYYTDDESKDKFPAPKGPVCTAFNGQQFICDTDYRVKCHMTEQEIAARVATLSCSQINRVCLTGGEPLIHSVVPLIRLLMDHQYLVHVETSGTVPFPDLLNNVWVACSPKHPFVASNKPRVSEWKFLVDPSTDIAGIEEFTRFTKACVFLQPINFVEAVDRDNLKRCEEVVRKHGNWRLSVQLHKILGVR